MATENHLKQNWETFDDVSLQKTEIEVVDEQKIGHPLENNENHEEQFEVKSENKVSSSILDPTKLEPSESKKPAKPMILSAPKNVNGKVLATVYPDNLTCDWITPPTYDVSNMPSILAIDVPTLPREDYLYAVGTIIKDFRFKMFSTIYSRMTSIWLTLWLSLLLIPFLLPAQSGWPIMILCLIWFSMFFIGIYLCAVIQRKIRLGLNKAVANSNQRLIDRHILLGIEDKGQLSCHKCVIHFIRFNIAECCLEIVRQLKIKKTGGCLFGGGLENEPPVEEYEKEAIRLILSYSQEYVKSVVKSRLNFPNRPIQGVSDYTPKHCKNQMCICQFVDEKHFNAKPKKWYVKYV